jgi:hypothetical protein
MSKLAKIIDSRVSLHEDTMPMKIIYKGVERVNQIVETAQSHSQSNTVFNFQPPSQNTIIDRKIYLTCDVVVQLDAPYDNDTDASLAPRQLPLHSCMNTLQLSINGQSLSTSPADYLHYVFRYNNNAELRDREYAGSPHMPDQFKSYDLGLINQGTARSPLENYGNVSSEISRGAFGFEDLGGNAYKFTFTEALRISPLVADGNYEEGMTNINQLQVDINWISNLEYMMSGYIAAGGVGDVLGVEIQNPRLELNYITAQRDMQIPSRIVLPYERVNRYQKRLTLQNFETERFVSDNIRMSSVPLGFYIFARQARDYNADFIWTRTTATAKLSNVNVQWNNEANLLSNATDHQLYKMSQSNGYNLSYLQREQLGDVYYFEFGKDIGLPQDLAPESRGDFNLQVSWDVTNLYDAQKTYECYLVIVQGGHIEISPNEALVSIGDITVEDVMQVSGQKEEMHQSEFEQGRAKAGSFYSKNKRVIRKVVKTVGDVAGVAAPLVPALKPVAAAAKLATKAMGGASLVGGHTRERYSRRRR